jgi:hypothetical protein
VEGLADALERVLYDEVFAQRCRDAVRETHRSTTGSECWRRWWPSAAPARGRPTCSTRTPAGRWCAAPGERYKPKTGLRRDLEIAADHLRDGGVAKVASKAVSRLAYVTGARRRRLRSADPAPG